MRTHESWFRTNRFARRILRAKNPLFLRAKNPVLLLASLVASRLVSLASELVPGHQHNRHDNSSIGNVYVVVYTAGESYAIHCTAYPNPHTYSAYPVWAPVYCRNTQPLCIKRRIGIRAKSVYPVRPSWKYMRKYTMLHFIAP